MPVEQFTVEQLKVRMAEILETWPLYRSFVYDGADGVVVVPEISLFCSSCKRDTFWQTNVHGQNFKQGFTTRTYKCKNCGGATVTYYFYWGVSTQKHNLFFKVGQHPELEERIPESLEQAFDAADLKMYKNALRLRNFNFGIGAVAYVRRVVENRMNDMLEILYEAAVEHNAPREVLARHDEVKRDIRFAAKVDYAGELLPATLRPAGKPNPIAILHELASEGLHAKTDEECVDIFDACRKTFEYVFGKMRIETEEAKKFVKELADLTEKKTRRERA
ncbi:MAG: hypothetical protein WBQ04_20225 [Candidatus Acidiferrales bacterium]